MNCQFKRSIVKGIMTRRKRDIFTVIESINNWFEASEHCTNPSLDHGCSATRSELNTESETSSKIGCPVARNHPTVGNREHGGRGWLQFP